jgi:hypothetical protein
LIDKQNIGLKDSRIADWKTAEYKTEGHPNIRLEDERILGWRTAEYCTRGQWITGLES